MPFPTFSTAAEVPEAFRDEYEEKDGKWVPKAVDVPDVTGLKTALQRERTEKEQAAARAATAEAALAEQKRTAEAKAKGISEEELAKIRKAEADARKPIEEDLVKTKAELRKLKLDDRVKAQWLEHGGIPERQEDAMDQLRKRTDLGDQDGIVYKDKDGNVTADAAAAFFAKFKAEKPWLFLGTGASGSGAEGPGKTATTVTAPDPAVVSTRRQEIAGAF